MSLYGTMRTGVSGMSAQANRLSTVGENIANASTTGYKKASVQFSSMILPTTNGAYNSGGVQTSVRYAISSQGTFSYTTSPTDLAINGRGFFVVEGSDGTEYLTRAGSFVPQDDGTLQNAAGFTLMGYEYSSTADPTIVVNGFDGLTQINLSSATLTAAASLTGDLDVNLPAKAAVGYSKTTSLVAYDSQGSPRLLDYIYTKTADNTWELDVQFNGLSVLTPAFDPTSVIDIAGNLDMSAVVGSAVTGNYSLVDTDGVTRPFSVTYTRTATGWDLEFEHAGSIFATDYIDDSEFDGAGNYIDPLPEVIPPLTVGTWSTGTINMFFSGLTSVAAPFSLTAAIDGTPAVAGSLIELTFDANGQLVSPSEIETEAVTIDGAVLNGLTLDISSSTQLASDFAVTNGRVDGNASSEVVGYEISDKGIVFLKFSNGDLQPRYRLAIADVQSPDNLNPVSGNVYSQSNSSGVIVMGYAGSSGYGTVLSGALEDSNVDIAEELTAMVEAQRNYTANSKVFQTGSELMEVLVNLKR